MTVVMYLRVGNKEQLDVETDMKKKEQEFENFCERKKHGMAGGYIPQQKIQMKTDCEDLIKKAMRDSSGTVQHGRQKKGAR